MNTLVILLLIIGITCVTISWFRHDLKCPPPQIIYKYVSANTIDTQFSKENLPSNLYSDMFNNDNIWIGGMSMSMGKTAGLSIPKNNKSPFTTTPSPFKTTSTPFTITPPPFTTTPSSFTTTPAPFTTTPAPFTTIPAEIQQETPAEIQQETPAEIQEETPAEIQEETPQEIETLENYQENFSIPFMSMTSKPKSFYHNIGPITGPYGL